MARIQLKKYIYSMKLSMHLDPRHGPFHQSVDKGKIQHKVFFWIQLLEYLDHECHVIPSKTQRTFCK